MSDTHLRKIIGILLLACLPAGLLFAAGSDRRPDSLTLQLQWKHEFQFAGYYAAIEKGYYKEVGLNVRLREASESENPIDAVVQGKAPYGTSTVSLLYWQHKPKDLVVLASIFQHSARSIVVNEKSGINHIDDLKNGRIALQPHCLELDAMLRTEGVKLKASQMNFSPDVFKQFLDGRLDAISCYSTNEPTFFEDAGISYRLFNPSMSGIDFYGDLLFTTKDYLLANPEQVANFRAASLKGWKYALSHSDELIDLIYDKYSQGHTKMQLKEEAEHMMPLIMPNLVEIGYSNPDRWENIIRLSQNLGLLDPSVHLKGWLYSDYEQSLNIPWKILGIIVFILFFAFVLLTIYYRINRKLRSEIKSRQHVQEALTTSNQQYQELNSTLEERIRQRTSELAKTNENLLMEVEVRSKAEREMNKARQEAEKANVAKSEFLSRMSHELRTPMNSILGFAQLLEMGDLNASQKRSVGNIIRSGRHLLELINEVLDISRIESGRLALSLESVKVSEIVHETTDVVRPQLTGKGIRLEMPEPDDAEMFVHADRQRLKQVLLNLLNNAVKYNRQEGQISIRSQTKRNTLGKEVVRISVADTGFGIAPADLDLIFTPFERIGADKTDVEGSGLGLAVVKKLTDAMGGNIGVESVLNEGSTFWLEFPKDERPLTRKENTAFLDDKSETDNIQTGVVLYVEDNAANIELVEQVIAHQRPNFRLIAHKTGKQTLDLVLKHRPNLILLDMNLPDIHGLDVLRQLKEDERTVSIPVMVISADAMPNQLARAYQAGAWKYLTKPLDVSELLKSIDEIIPPGLTEMTGAHKDDL